MAFYFEKFEHRIPPKPLPYSVNVELLYQFFATISLVIGAWYIGWRWCFSLNYDALWFSIPLLLAETFAYIGLVLFTINLWQTRDCEQKPPPEFYGDCFTCTESQNRVVSVDVFFATYNEDPELVRLGLLDAKKITYPHPINIRIYVLDDGRRPEMRKVAEEEGATYISRDNNTGYKAGNMRNAMEHTSGDFIVICDADTRPFSTILEHTLGYFRDKKVAWVQTPQWFYDLPEGKSLDEVWQKYFGTPGKLAAHGIQKLVGPITLGRDPFVNDPQMFYDVIQRRRNWANAAFCCGAASIHRREAVMESALRAYATQVDKEVNKFSNEIEDAEIRQDFEDAMTRQVALDTEMTPYKFHVSEDIYTSIILHSDPERGWRSVLHPSIESKMLSPQDLMSWTIQRFKYAGGTLDIAMNDNPLLNKGLSIPQKLMYGTTIWSYLGGIWNFIFLISPLIYLFTGIAPVSTFSLDFFKHILPFLFFTELAMMMGTWGIASFQSKASYLAFFPVNLRAIWTVLKGERIHFPTTPKDRQSGNFFRIVLPQFSVMVLTMVGIIYAVTMYLIGDPDPGKLNGLILNTFWGAHNIIVMSGMVMAAFWKPDDET